MRILLVVCFMLLCRFTQAGEIRELRLIQANAELPAINLWLNLPNGSVLNPSQFNVSIGSHPASVSAIDSFSQTGDGVGYVFLVDISKSLSEQQFMQIRQALQRWLDGMNSHDQAALISVGSQVKLLVPFTNDHNKLANAIDQLALTDMETNLFRGFLEAMTLGRQQGPGLPVRRAIVVLSDGIDDNVNGVTLDEVFKQNDEYRVPIHSIGFAAAPINDTKRKGLQVLGMLARQSGGHFVQAEAGKLDQAYDSQFQVINQAYRLRLQCPECRADGQSYRLNLIWSDGVRSLSDGLDLRLLPTREESPDQASHPIIDLDNPLMQIYIVSLVTLVAGILLLWLYLRRKALNFPENVAPPLPAKLVDPKSGQPGQSASLAAGGFNVSLTTVSGNQRGQSYNLQINSSVIIGRLPTCELCLADDMEVSAQHAVMRVRDNRLMVRDLHSTNGTLVNGVPINNEFPLRNGDLLLLGRTELRVVLS